MASSPAEILSSPARSVTVGSRPVHQRRSWGVFQKAAAAVLLSQGQTGKIYELAGDASYTLSDFAAEIAKQSGKPVAYQDMPPADFAAALKHAGLPEGLADLLADSDAGASRGGLFDDSRTLSTLIGRPTTPMPEVIRKALAV